MTLVQEEAVALVFAREGRLDAGFMLEEALVEVAGDPGVERAGVTAEDVHVSFGHGGSPIETASGAGQKDVKNRQRKLLKNRQRP